MRLHPDGGGRRVERLSCKDVNCQSEHLHVLTDDELAQVKVEKFWQGYNHAFGIHAVSE